MTINVPIESYRRLLDAEKALAESVKLQSHYAELLNQYDGGDRMQFNDSAEWIARLKKVGSIR